MGVFKWLDAAPQGRNKVGAVKSCVKLTPNARFGHSEVDLRLGR